MTEFDPSKLEQPAQIKRPSILQILKPTGHFDCEGYPLQATSRADYQYVGGLALAPYTRVDSTSRKESGFEYNATWYDHMLAYYGESLQLLESLRQSFLADRGVKTESDSDLALEFTSVCVNLPLYLLWRQDGIANGKIPVEVAVINQALLGIRSVLTGVKPEKLLTLTGQEIATTAEKTGLLVGVGHYTDLPVRVCPVKPEMIANLSQETMAGNPKRSPSSLFTELNIDMAALRAFVAVYRAYQDYHDQLIARVNLLWEANPLLKGPFDIQEPKTKLELFDEIVASFGRLLDGLQPGLYDILGRTDNPPKMHPARMYAHHKQLAMVRYRIYQEDPASRAKTKLEDVLPRPDPEQFYFGG